MTDSSPYSETDQDVDAAPDPASSRSMPRWVKVSGIVVAVLVLIFVVAQLTGIGGDHGPSRHSGAPSACVSEDDGDGHTPPPGMEHEG
jgi:hypothetical protein